MSRTRYRIFETEYPYFLTSTIVGWLPVFTRREAVEIVFEAWRYHQRESGLQIFGYVVLENHLHWIARAPELPKVIQSFKKLHRSTDHRPARTKLRRRAVAATANTQARTQGGKRLPSLAGGKQTKAASERRDAVVEAGIYAQQSGGTRLHRQPAPLAVFKCQELCPPTGIDRRSHGLDVYLARRGIMLC